MEKPYLNLRELTEILGLGTSNGKKVMQHLLEVAKERNYYIPPCEKQILIPTHLVKSELKIKEINLNK